MKVLQVTTNYPTKSNPILGIFMKEQVESVEKYGVTNTIFFSNGTEANVGKKNGGMITHIKSVFKLSWHLLTHKYDLIHCHSALSGLILLLSGGAFFNKSIISFQNDPDKEGDKRYFELLYRFFNKVIVKKPTSYNSWEKVVYLPNGCNKDFFKPLDKVECKKTLNLDVAKRYILFVDSNRSRNRTQKRKDRFDETLKILRTQYGYTDIEELVMIGVKRDDVPAYMNACELHLLCSDQEGSPNSVKECMFCNVPVVCTDVGNVKDLLDGVPHCYVSEQFSAEELAQLVDQVLNADDETLEIRNVIMHKGLDIDSVAKRLVEVYRSI